MVRAVIQYEREPDPDRYARHVEEFVTKIAATRSEEFAASGKDAMEMGIPFTVTFTEVG